ncbi:MAG: hypothetical protein ACREB0_05890, partial [Sphingopyxis sp.]
GRTLRAGASTPPPPGAADWFPGIRDGLRTMTFVEAVIENSAGEAKWTALADVPNDRPLSSAIEIPKG